jgi:prephenate dehydrogenase
VVTDAGSTKREIYRAAREGLPQEVHFIGGHPMAGSHQRGFDFARDDLFQGAPYALISDAEIDLSNARRADAMSRLHSLVEAIGGKPVLLTAERHDHAVARISQAPQLLATALALAAASAKDTDAMALAGSGFADMTRLAASHWSVWEDILSTNHDEIGNALKEFEDRLGVISKAMATRDSAVMESMFRAANDFIRRVNEKKALNV